MASAEEAASGTHLQAADEGALGGHAQVHGLGLASLAAVRTRINGLVCRIVLLRRDHLVEAERVENAFNKWLGCCCSRDKQLHGWDISVAGNKIFTTSPSAPSLRDTVMTPE